MLEVMGEDVDPINAQAIEAIPGVFIIGAKTAAQIVAERAIDPLMVEIEAYQQRLDAEK